MKILIVNRSDIDGGAARSAYRLHRTLLDSNVNVQMLVQSKRSHDDTVILPINRKNAQNAVVKLRNIMDIIPVKLYKNKTNTLFSPAWLPLGGIVDTIEAIDPDIVHLHWICGGMIRIEELSRIKKPIVWSLHDMWAFTGGCHYDEECGKYMYSCGSCPVLRSKKVNDLSRDIFVRKQRAFANIDNLTIVGLSSWLADCARQSTLFANNQVVNLPNPIDTVMFAPVDKTQARWVLNLPLDKKLVLYGAMSATNDPRKGYTLLLKALKTLQKKSDIDFVVFGNDRPGNTECSFVTHYLGYLDDESLHLLYCAADVMVVPSLQENLSNTIMESLACGTPVVGFNIGGNRDLIDHKQNGYLAEPFNLVDLAEGIRWVLDFPEYAILSNNAREKILKRFDSKVVVKQYLDLYKHILR